MFTLSSVEPKFNYIDMRSSKEVLGYNEYYEKLSILLILIFWGSNFINVVKSLKVILCQKFEIYRFA